MKIYLLIMIAKLLLAVVLTIWAILLPWTKRANSAWFSQLRGKWVVGFWGVAGGLVFFWAGYSADYVEIHPWDQIAMVLGLVLAGIFLIVWICGLKGSESLSADR